MKIKKLFLVLGVVLALGLMGTPALAASWVESSTESFYDTSDPVNPILVTTITWDSSFEDLAYQIDNPTTMSVDWSIDAGDASYYDFTLKNVTPKKKSDPAGAVLGTVIGGDPVSVSVTFDQLHLNNDNVDMGNAHFKLWLMVDTTAGDGDNPDTVVSFGVNLHVEEPQ